MEGVFLPTYLSDGEVEIIKHGHQNMNADSANGNFFSEQKNKKAKKDHHSDKIPTYSEGANSEVFT